MTTYYVYIISNAHNNILYTGVTYNIVNRIEEHKNRLHPKSFSAKYNVNKLVYY
ncbi:MAG: GIY-YIG nuclease family protein, partial [Bacteroidetes bacterium]|nr:GIY-YIG nuclease family protein [Bacteroidota bacterium]